jgi:hypothetical protein
MSYLVQGNSIRGHKVYIAYPGADRCHCCTSQPSRDIGCPTLYQEGSKTPQGRQWALRHLGNSCSDL